MWRHIARSVRGASHEKTGEPCQDSHVARILDTQDKPALLACVSDGAGSAAHSHHGAQIACDVIVARCERHLERCGSLESLTRDDVIVWCEGIRAEIQERADESELTSRDYACTLSAALVTPLHTVFFQIGDGAIVARRGSAYGVVFWPQSGEYANSTNFITQDGFEDHLGFQSTPGGFSEVALFTDGLERLALSFDAQTAHAPFFDPLFHAVQQVEDLDKLNEELQVFLTSELVQNRSDDDKTVILAAQSADR